VVEKAELGYIMAVEKAELVTSGRQEQARGRRALECFAPILLGQEDRSERDKNKVKKKMKNPRKF
jgi:hypothetical protein